MNWLQLARSVSLILVGLAICLPAGRVGALWASPLVLTGPPPIVVLDATIDREVYAAVGGGAPLTAVSHLNLDDVVEYLQLFYFIESASLYVDHPSVGGNAQGQSDAVLAFQRAGPLGIHANGGVRAGVWSVTWPGLLHLDARADATSYVLFELGAPMALELYHSVFASEHGGDVLLEAVLNGPDGVIYAGLWDVDVSEAHTISTILAPGTYEWRVSGAANAMGTYSYWTGDSAYGVWNSSLTFTPVPEPSTWVLAAMALCGLPLACRARFKKSRRHG